MSQQNHSSLSEQFSDAMLDLLPFSAQLLDAEGRTVKVNRAWSELWHAPEDDDLRRYVLSGQYSVLTDPQLAAKGLTQYFERAYAGESVSIPEILYDPVLIGRRGCARWVKGHARPIFGQDGRVAGVMLTHEDVTERIDIQRALTQSEERLRLATDAGRIGTWDWDIVTGEFSWSARAFELHGLQPDERVRGIQDILDVVHPDARAHVGGRLRAALDGGATAFTIDYKGVMPDGEARWYASWAQIVRAGNGEAVRMIGATIDITERKRNEEALRAAVGELKDAGRRKDEFLAMLAHELRNPLAPISAGAELLQLRPDDAGRVRHASGVITRQVQHLVKLVDDLLDVSRINRGMIRLETGVLDFAAVVDSAVEQTRPLIDARAHTLVLDVQSGPMPVLADRARLVQVLANLLANAAKYTPPGGRITLSASVRGRQVRVEVRDNGIGIEAALLPHVFDFFIQGERSLDRSSGGLGIGLALVRNLVGLHHGRVEAHSAGPGQGSVFTVVLPLAGGAPGPSGADEQDALSAAGRSARVLIVDDNADAAQSLAALLAAQGYEVSTAADAASALAAAAGAWPDIFVLDIGLPDMTGHELVGRLRAMRPDTPTIFVALAGYGQASDRAQSEASGFDFHLVKPVGYQQLAALFTSGLRLSAQANRDSN